MAACHESALPRVCSRKGTSSLCHFGFSVKGHHRRFCLCCVALTRLQIRFSMLLESSCSDLLSPCLCNFCVIDQVIDRIDSIRLISSCRESHRLDCPIHQEFVGRQEPAWRCVRPMSIKPRRVLYRGCAFLGIPSIDVDFLQHFYVVSMFEYGLRPLY